jgi:hypothetical protein
MTFEVPVDIPTPIWEPLLREELGRFWAQPTAAAHNSVKVSARPEESVGSFTSPRKPASSGPYLSGPEAVLTRCMQLLYCVHRRQNNSKPAYDAARSLCDRLRLEVMGLHCVT